MKNNKSNPVQVTVQVDSIPAGITEEKPTHTTDVDEAIEDAGEISTPTNDIPAKAHDEVPQSVPHKVSLPIHDDYELSQVMLASVEQQAKISLPGLVPGVRYTAKRICGKAFWKMLPKGDKIVAGICMSRLVATNRLPLIETGTSGSNSKVYALK